MLNNLKNSFVLYDAKGAAILCDFPSDSLAPFSAILDIDMLIMHSPKNYFVDFSSTQPTMCVL